MRLQLNANASAKIIDNRTFAGLTLNGGTLEIQTFTDAGTIAPTPVTVTTLDVTGSGGTIKIDLASLNDIKTSATDYNTFYDYDPAALYQTRLVAATNVTGTPGGLTLQDASGNSLASDQAMTRKTMDGTEHTGNATFDYTALVDSTSSDKGIYLGYGLTQLESLVGKIVALDSSASAATTPTITAKLTGAGGFTFSGTKDAEVGNAASNYAGATVVDAMEVKMPANNAFGATSSLELTNNGSVDMDGKSQTVGALKGTTGTEIALGALTVNQSANTNFAGELSGAGALTK